MGALSEQNRVWWHAVPISMLCALVYFEMAYAFSEQVIILVCEEQQVTNSSVTCDSHLVAHLASEAQGWAMFASGLGSLLMVGLAGALNDHFGRRTMLLASVLSNVFNILPSLLIEYAPFVHAHWRVFSYTGWALTGLGMGGLAFQLLSIFSFVADTVTVSSRYTILLVPA